MPAIGWLATGLVEAEAYFLNERLDSTYWDALTVTSAKDEKTAVLKMAYNRIRFHSGFSIPATPTAAQTAKLVMAQLETAYYMAQHLTDEDKRKGLQAQGVIEAGIVKEKYSEAALFSIPLPYDVAHLLDEFEVVDPPFYAVDIDRDEDQGVNNDVVDVD